MNTPLLRSSILLAASLLVVGCARHSGSAPALLPQGVPQFETRTEISTGTGDHADFYVADLNGDTFLDMVVVSFSGELRVLLGNGTGLVEGQLLQIGGNPIWISGGDLDSDGDCDVVVVRATDQVVDVFFNDGSGTYSAGPSLPIGSEPLAVVVADESGDGNLDIVVSGRVSPAIRVFNGDGAGNFGPANFVAMPGGGQAYNIAVGDVSRDGLPDLVVTDTDNGRVVLFVATPGPLTLVFELDVAGAPRAASIGDLSGDGFADLAISEAQTGRLVVITGIDFSGGTGSTALYTSFDIQLTAAPTVSAIGDVTGDGLDDLIACMETTASVVVVPQLPGGGLGAYSQLDSTGLTLRPFVGDFDQNGKNDLFALSGLGNRINLWFADNSGRLAGAYNYDAGLTEAAFLGGADFDRDGDFEVAVGGFSTTQLSIMERDLTGELVPAHFVEIGATVLQVETVDLDLDGREDVLMSVNGGVKVLRNLSTPAGYDFELLPGLVIAITTASAPFGVEAADFDRDGDFDIAVCDYGGDALHIIEGTPVPFVFVNETITPLSGGPVDVTAADFSGDGWLDLAVSRAGFSDITILTNNGAGDFSATLSQPVGQAPNYLLTGDFNRDQRADIVVSNGDEGTMTVLFGGPSGFTLVDYPAGQTPTALLADDLTGDGIDDVLVTSLQSGDFRVLVGDGSGGFPSIHRFPGTHGASDAVLQDMDRDGKKDLLIASLITSRVSLVRNVRQ